MSDVPLRTIIFHMERGSLPLSFRFTSTPAISIVMAILYVGGPVVLFRSVSLVKNIHPCLPNPLGEILRFFQTVSLMACLFLLAF